MDSARLILFLERTWKKKKTRIKNENSVFDMKKTKFFGFGMYQIIIHGCKINGPYGKAGNTQETIMRLLEKDDFTFFADK